MKKITENLDKFNPEDLIVITDKWNGIPGVFSNLKWYEKVANFLMGGGNILYKLVEKELSGKIQKGMTLYGEIVGFYPSGAPIKASYDYGIAVGEHRFVIYRITQKIDSGRVIEYTWQQVKNYCRDHSLETVKEAYYGFANKFMPRIYAAPIEDWRHGLLNNLKRSVSYTCFIEKDCPFCTHKVPSEGICVRIDNMNAFTAFKLQSSRFMLKNKVK